MAESDNILTRTTDLIQWFLPKLERMPRNYKFLFGDKIVELLLTLLERLIEAFYTRDKIKPLHAANLAIEKLRRLLRICAEMKWISLPQLEFATRELNGIGGMTGGWLRQQQQQQQQQQQPVRRPGEREPE